MELELNVHHYFHGDPEVLHLLKQVHKQGATIMSIQDDMAASVAAIDTTISGTVVPLMTTIGAELDELSKDLAAAIAAGAVGSAFLQPLKDKLDSLNSSLTTAATALAATGTKDTPPVVPPAVVPLAASYADKASFDAAVAAYTGPEEVDYDSGSGASVVKTGTLPALAYFLHSADGHIDNVGPAN